MTQTPPQQPEASNPTAELDALIERMAELDERAESLLALRPTLPPRVEIDTDGLQQISTQFTDLAAQMAQVVEIVEQQEKTVQAGRSSSLTTQRILAELDKLVIPTLQHLQRGLQNWSTQTERMSANVQRAAAALENLGSRVKSIEDVKNLVDKDAIEKAVQEELARQQDHQQDQPGNDT
ncbi:MAG: hypothetical protein KF726_08140 [Anaerolineae bacterium]|nr:hypothetical protein [Anaerolineae bacterium]